MAVFTPEKALMWMKKTPALIRVTLSGVNQARATGSRDGEDGWNVLEIVCHLNDYEQIFIERLRMMLDQDRPAFPAYDQNALVVENQYDAQQFDLVVTSWISRRAAHVRMLEALTPEQWERRGIHPSFGEMSVLDESINATLHDVNHLEQITRVLGLGG